MSSSVLRTIRWLLGRKSKYYGRKTPEHVLHLARVEHGHLKMEHVRISVKTLNFPVHYLVSYHFLWRYKGLLQQCEKIGNFVLGRRGPLPSLEKLGLKWVDAYMILGALTFYKHEFQSFQQLLEALTGKFSWLRAEIIVEVL